MRIIEEDKLPRKECYNCEYYSAVWKWGKCSNGARKKRAYYEVCSKWEKSKIEPYRYGKYIILWKPRPNGSTEPYYYSGWTFIKSLVYLRDKGICQKCGRTTNVEVPLDMWDGNGYEVHHIIPKSTDGSDHLMNLLLLCLKCHNRTKNKFYLRRHKWVGIDTTQQKLT